MSATEIIGMVISLLSLIYLFFRNQPGRQQQPKHPRTAEREQHFDAEAEEDFQALLQALKGEERQVKPAPPPRFKPVLPEKPKSLSTLEGYHLSSSIEKRSLQSSLERRQLKSTLASKMKETAEEDHLVDHQSRKPSRARSVIKRLHHLPDIVIYTEILNRPKGL